MRRGPHQTRAEAGGSRSRRADSDSETALVDAGKRLLALHGVLKTLSLTKFKIDGTRILSPASMSVDMREELLDSWPDLVSPSMPVVAITSSRSAPPRVRVNYLPRGLLRLCIDARSEGAYSIFRDVILASKMSLYSLRIEPSPASDFLLPALAPVAAWLQHFSAQGSADVLEVLKGMVNLRLVTLWAVDPPDRNGRLLRILHRLPLSVVEIVLATPAIGMASRQRNSRATSQNVLAACGLSSSCRA